MINLAGYEFDDHRQTIICSHVLSGSPINFVIFDDEGELQFLCSDYGHEVEEYQITCLHHVTNDHPRILNLPHIDQGQSADRDETNNRWMITPFSYADDD